MRDTGLLAKISRPRLRRAIVRGRLHEQLTRLREAPLVWIAGPPGAGKTTLVAGYVEGLATETLWYQVDGGDSDPASFFYYLNLAAERYKARRRSLPLLSAEERSDLAAFTRRYFRALFASVPPGTQIVLDNFQEASDAGLAALLREAAIEVPPSSSMVIISRSLPPSEFSELLATDQMAVLGWTELRLTLEESRAISAAKGVVDEDIVHAAHERADGWAAGLTLILEQLSTSDSREWRLGNDTHEHVFSYFSTLLFRQIPEQERNSLVRLAFLPQMTARMAEAITGNPRAGQLLERLYRRHFFTQRRAAPEPTFQFHALFRSFLESQVREQFDSVALNELLRQSAESVQANGQTDAAVALYVEANAWSRAAALIRFSASTLIATGRWDTLAEWIGLLPADVQRQDPWLGYWLGRAVAYSHPLRGRALLTEAHASFRDAGDVMGRLLTACAMVRIIYNGNSAWEETSPFDIWLHEVVELIGLQPAYPSVETEVEVHAALVTAGLWVIPRHPDLWTWAERLHVLLHETFEPTQRVAAAHPLLQLACDIGAFDMGESLIRMLEPLLSLPGIGPRLAFFWQLHMGIHASRQLDHENAHRRWQEAIRIAAEHGLTELVWMVVGNQFRGSSAAIAEASLRQVEALPIPDLAFSAACLGIYRAHTAFAKGRREDALELARASWAATRKAGQSTYRPLFASINADLMLETGDVAAAVECMEDVAAYVNETPAFENYRAALALLGARLCGLRGDVEGLKAFLRDALLAASPRRGIYFLRNVSHALRAIVPQAFSHGLETERARDVVRLFRLRPAPDAPESWPWTLRIRVLGEFRIELRDEPLQFGRKVPRKVLALLKVLAALGPAQIPQQQLLDTLWADEEGDAGHEAFSTALARLRRLLGDGDLIRQQGGKLSLDRSRCWVDLWALERALAAPAPEGVPDVPPGQRLDALVNLYRGPLLADDIEAPWAIAPRERVRGKLIHAIGGVCQRLEEVGEHEAAIDGYLKGLEAELTIETFHQGLMRCYWSMGRRTEAIAVHARLVKILDSALGLKPSAETEALHRRISTDDRGAAQPR